MKKQEPARDRNPGSLTSDRFCLHGQAADGEPGAQSGAGP